ncbi:MAG: hypothetical protein COV45_03695 [Deltaproteobacteria bacterium CG11_big_fil_rev_8_21_14_0_20_47_16]|nr:MAG: hypothetical protein COV45_03695 [Deltaproteobacteria bacterium CG11_big_fil_rev_8_21_14_0_20_47_16]
MNSRIATTCVVLLATLLAACGSGSSVAPQTDFNSDLTTPPAAPTASVDMDPLAKRWEPLLRSKSYTGQIAVMFQESAAVRLNNLDAGSGAGMTTTFRSKTNVDVSALNALFAAHPEARIQRGFPNLDADALDQHVQDVRMTQGYPMTDWGSLFIINVMDADEALEILNGLQHQPALLDFTHPLPLMQATTIKVPNINPGPGQDYLLDPASTGGVNVKAAWDAGLDGTGVIMEDIETNWNVNHVDLPLSAKDFVSSLKPGDPGYQQAQSDDNKQHGTAVAGVLVGKDNGFGITGMAPAGKLYLGQWAGGWPIVSWEPQLGDSQAKYADGNPKMWNMRPGDVFVIEMGDGLPGFGGIDCQGSETSPLGKNCAPMEAYKLDMKVLKELIDYQGYIVVEASGNSGWNLDDPKYQIGVDLSKESSGAIMVGASMGGTTTFGGKHAYEKAPFSNCGSRVDVFAWGLGVTTAGYGNHPISAPSDKNQWYTGTFAGTSSATAIIGGSAVLLQQYARQLYNDPNSVCKIKSWEYMYLSSQQMREVMVKSGTPAKPYVSDPVWWNGLQDPSPVGCNIGMQPDLAKAMQIIKDGCEGKPTGVKATVKDKDLAANCPAPTLANPTPKKAEWCPKTGPIQPEIGKMMDLDGDGRADLIAFGRDRKWYVDLSSVGPTTFDGGTLGASDPKDNFGTWNLVFDLKKDVKNPIPDDAMLFPVVADYNTDGKADLGLYDSVHGKWYVHFTSGNTLNTDNMVNGVNPWPGWDMILDYSTQPHWQPYSRPIVQDYNGQDNDPITLDHYMDLAIITPDGWWLVDFGGQNINANYGSFDSIIQSTVSGNITYDDYDATTGTFFDKYISDVPAWAFLPVVYPGTYSLYQNKSNSGSGFRLKIPDSVVSEDTNRLIGSFYGESGWTLLDNVNRGDNANYFMQARFLTTYHADLGTKARSDPNNNDIWLWQISHDSKDWDDQIYVNPYINFDGVNCRPIPGDYDGDGYDDRAVLCNNGEWRISYTSTKYPVNMNLKNTATITITEADGSKKQVAVSDIYRKLNHGQKPSDPLPGFVYPGGISFKEEKEIFETVNYLCPTLAPSGNNAPCSLVTMTPAPVSPYFPQCANKVRKQYVVDPCTTTNKVACETMHIQQAGCVYDYLSK